MSWARFLVSIFAVFAVISGFDANASRHFDKGDHAPRALSVLMDNAGPSESRRYSGLSENNLPSLSGGTDGDEDDSPIHVLHALHALTATQAMQSFARGGRTSDVKPFDSSQFGARGPPIV